MTANGAWQWLRALTWATFGHAEKSPQVQMMQATKIKIEIHTSLPDELDGEARPRTNSLRVDVVPPAVTIRVVSRATG